MSNPYVMPILESLDFLGRGFNSCGDMVNSRRRQAKKHGYHDEVHNSKTMMLWPEHCEIYPSCFECGKRDCDWR